MTGHSTGQAVEQAVRQSYGRLVALLARETRDMSAAEDALSEALKAALETWPMAGVPRVPEAWLLTTARRKLLDRMRHAKVVEASVVSLLALAERTEETLATRHRIPDHRLELMFACCHPDVDEDIRTPLMLQTVLGVDAASIASAFLVSPAAMGQRLSRAKARIRQAGLAFELPERRDMASRLAAVLSSVYVAFSLDFGTAGSETPAGDGLAEEALHLAMLLAGLLPEEPEALGLAALALHVHARRDARLVAGRYVPLDAQDTRLWDRDMIAQAEDLLGRAAACGSMGRFQLEAAIQSVHAGRAVCGSTDWRVVLQLYEGLVRLCPTTGAAVARAGAHARVFGAAAGLALLERLPAEGVLNYQPFWATRAALLAEAGQQKEAETAYGRAIGLCSNIAVRTFLIERQSAVANPQDSSRT